MSQFIKNIRAGKVPLYFESAEIPKNSGPLYQLNGNSFHKFNTQSNLGKSKLILITHPEKEKNYEIE